MNVSKSRHWFWLSTGVFGCFFKGIRQQDGESAAETKRRRRMEVEKNLKC